MKTGWAVSTEGNRVAVVVFGDRLLNLNEVSSLALGEQVDERILLGDSSLRARISEFLDNQDPDTLVGLDVEPQGFLPPVNPGQVVAVGLNYRSHATEMGRPFPTEPVLFGKARGSVVGHGEPVRIPTNMGRVDYEGEIAVIIGRAAHRVSASTAAGVIAGYTLLNDVTLRDVQGQASSAGLPWHFSKGLDSFCPAGPFLVSADEVDDPGDLRFTLSVNGEVRQTGWTGDLVFGIYELVEYITRYMTLEPGDMIATGTPSGVGPLSSGDLVRVESQLLGVLENPVVAQD